MHHKRAFDRLLAEEIASARYQSQPGEDILSRLVDCTDEEGESLSDSAIRDHLVTLLIAGHETTATALAWAFYEVTRHPEIERWLLDEIATLGSEPDPVQLSELPALHAVSRETLRLHPIVPEFFRTVRMATGCKIGTSLPASFSLVRFSPFNKTRHSIRTPNDSTLSDSSNETSLRMNLPLLEEVIGTASAPPLRSQKCLSFSARSFPDTRCSPPRNGPSKPCGGISR